VSIHRLEAYATLRRRAGVRGEMVPSGILFEPSRDALRTILRNRNLVQEIQLGLGFFQRFKSGLQMRCLKIVKVRPAKHVVDNRFGGVNPFLRPAQDGKRKRPSGRVAVDAGARGGHGWCYSIQYARVERSIDETLLPIDQERFTRADEYPSDLWPLRLLRLQTIPTWF
jgi:hypothetical protein